MQPINQPKQYTYVVRWAGAMRRWAARGPWRRPKPSPTAYMLSAAISLHPRQRGGSKLKSKDKYRRNSVYVYHFI